MKALIGKLASLGIDCGITPVNTGTKLYYRAELMFAEDACFQWPSVYSGEDNHSENEALLKAVCNLPHIIRRRL